MFKCVSSYLNLVFLFSHIKHIENMRRHFLHSNIVKTSKNTVLLHLIKRTFAFQNMRDGNLLKLCNFPAMKSKTFQH